ncbi:MAG: PaaI family thioesterase [Acidimicrobiia bacterium]
MADHDTSPGFDRRIADGLLATNDLSVGLSSLLGIRLEALEPGYLRAALDVGPDLLTPFGNLHGGAVAALVDHALGCVLYPHMTKGQWAATTEFKLNYLKPVSGGVLVAEATILNMTRRSAVVRIDVQNEGRVVAAAQGTVTIVDPKPRSEAGS